MIKFFNICILYLIIGVFAGCSQILQTVELQINSEDVSMQQEFNVIEKTLTIKEAKAANNTPYMRTILQSGRGMRARSIPESLALVSNFPTGSTPFAYKIDVGDTLTFSRLIENNRSSSETQSQWPINPNIPEYKLGIGDTLALTLMKVETVINQTNQIGSGNNNNNNNQNLITKPQQKDITINSTGRIGSDGSVLLLEIGRLEANGKTLNELRSEVRNILIRNGVIPRFQLEIVEFKSQKAYLTVNGSSNIIVLNDQRTTIKDILTSAGIGFKPGVVTRIRLQRDANEYRMSLRGIFGENAPDINVIARDHLFVEDSSANIVSTASTVDYNGNVVFEGVGKIKASGLSLDELRTEIENLMQRLPDSQNAFQIQITKFSSQTALLSIPGKPGGVIVITDTPIGLDKVLMEAGLSLDGNIITRINLQRQSEEYNFTLDELLKSKSQRIYIQPEDRITVENLSYKENKVFIVGGVSPQIFKINPANRETLADVLFTSGGPLGSSSAKRSEVYLLRGSNPVVAYHLDAQSPTRLIVADAMELRPNDILYVAEQPIISFNRTLATIVPLRILLRDLQDENIP